jgi:phosphoribosyl 1,2-cyclic phosphodiesterase
MKLSVLGSSSSGNGYLLHQEGEALVIEAGIRLMDVKKKLDFRIADVRACIISHGHKDHSRYIREYANAGIDVLGPAEAFTGSHNRFHPVLPGKGYKLGRFSVIPFQALHDVTCFGYLINHPDTGRILFLTDTWLCEFAFTGLIHIIIEANYADDILEENIIEGIEHPSKRERLLTSHMELESTKAFLKAQDLSKVQHIMLIHLSERNSDAERFQKEIAGLTGLQVFLANPGESIDLSIDPF